MISTRFFLLSLTLFAIAFSAVDAQQVLRGRVASSSGRRRGLKASKAPTVAATVAATVATTKASKAPSVGRESVIISVEISESPKTTKAGKSEEVKVSFGDDIATLAENKAIEISEEIEVDLERYPKESPVKSFSPTIAGTI